MPRPRAHCSHPQLISRSGHSFLHGTDYFPLHRLVKRGGKGEKKKRSARIQRIVLAPPGAVGDTLLSRTSSATPRIEKREEGGKPVRYHQETRAGTPVSDSIPSA